MSPVHNLPTWLLKVNVNIILPSRLTTSEWSLSVRFPHQNNVCTSVFGLDLVHYVHEHNFANLIYLGFSSQFMFLLVISHFILTHI